MSEQKVIRIPLPPKRVEQPERGWLLQLMPWLSQYTSGIGDIHIVSTEPGIARGNHYHKLSTEALLPLQGTHRIVWEENGERVEALVQDAAELFIFAPGVPHVIRNEGTTTALAIAVGSREFQPDQPDRYPFPLLADAPPQI